MDDEIVKVEVVGRIEEIVKINNWYYAGMFQIGGDISLFYGIGWNRIKEIYNVDCE